MNYKIKDLVKKEDPIYGHYVAQPLGAIIAKFVSAWPISPNIITLLSLISAVGSSALFINNHLLLGVVFLNFALILDCTDGQLAKIKNQGSKLGAYLDSFFDRLKDGLVVFGLALGNYMYYRDYDVFIIGFFALFLFFIRKFNTYYRDIESLKTNQTVAKANDLISDDNSSQFKKSLKHSLFFKEADRVLFFSFFAIINQVYLGLYIFMIMQAWLTIASTYINIKKYSKNEK